MADKKNWLQLLAYVTGSINQELLLRNQYLAAENHVLKSQIKVSVRESPGRASVEVCAVRVGVWAIKPGQASSCAAKAR